MQRCLQLAANGFPYTASNPMVGCVIVHEETVIAEGFHKKFGLPHAEVDAIQHLADLSVLPESTVYVNLEPCSHYGKTPPCADMLIQHGVKKVVIASLDPNPLVAGNGINKLREAGVDVVVGVLDKENKELNKRFFIFHTHKRPYIVLKWAESNDGFIAPENHKGSFKLTNDNSNILVHEWRSQEMGILVGRGTVQNDNPQLTVRHIKGQNPVRIVFDPDLTLDLNYTVFNSEATTLVFNCIMNDEKSGVRFIKLNKHDFLNEAMHYLHEINIVSVMVEGGLYTLSHFIEADLWDEARVFKTKHILNNGIAAPQINGVQKNISIIDNDTLIQLIPN